VLKDPEKHSLRDVFEHVGTLDTMCGSSVGTGVVRASETHLKLPIIGGHILDRMQHMDGRVEPAADNRDYWWGCNVDMCFF
jgi:hypothetical protein